MDPNLSLHHICRAIRYWKQRLVTLDGVGTDIPPALLTLQGNALIGAHSLDDVEGTLRDASVIAAIALSDCDRAALAFEAYVDIGCHHSPDTELAPLFAAGDPDVEEAVMVSYVTRDGRWAARTFPYTYNGRTVTWKRATPTGAFAADTLARQRRALTEGFDRQAERPGPAIMVAGSQLEIVGEEHCEHMAVVSFAVTAPCPCGSYRPIHECCARDN